MSGYTFTLEPRDGALSLEEWAAFVDHDRDLEPVGGTAARVRWVLDREWGEVAHMQWVAGFGVAVEFESLEDGDPLVALVAMAEKLGCRVRGEGGEYYDGFVRRAEDR